jgi:hypothetical protein
MAGKNFGLPAPKPIPENAPKLTGPLLSSSDVIKASMSGKSQIIGGSDPGFVDTATRPKSSGGGGLLGDIGNVVSNAGSAITQTVKPVADKITPNLDQDLAAPVVEALQDINVPRPNIEQDLTKISVQGLQESAVEQGTQLQQEAINTGTKIQETVVQAGSNLQEAAVQAGASISGGQSNPTLEKAAEQVTTYVEDKVVPVVKDLYATAYGDKNPQLKFVQAIVHDFERNTPGIEALGNLDASLNASDDNYSSNTTPYGAADLDAKDFTGNDDPFGDIETATTKADKMTEEERLRRIRRLMLNRYGREDTILTGAKDPMNRRRYASAL